VNGEVNDHDWIVDVPEPVDVPLRESREDVVT
jgi:hypothetical protein